MSTPAREPLDADRLRRELLRPAGAWASLDVVPSVPSTNARLVELASHAARTGAGSGPGGLPAPAALVAEHQTAGLGRAGRTWTTPPGAALTVSALLRPQVPPERLGWLPLLSGLAVVRVLRDAGVAAALKWPNDVLLPAAGPVPGLGAWRKVAGVLAQVVPAAPGARPPARGEAGRPGSVDVVVGIGLNVSQTADELPVPTATSLALAGAGGGGSGARCLAGDRTGLLVALLRELAAVVARWEAHGVGAAGAGGETPLAEEYAAASATLGQGVRVELAGGAGVIEGVAVRVDDDGALVVAGGDGERVVAAGDVHHLRRA
ncbi:biotin--[acetyl-CoA-carboxylase] ligase [Xylanimonas oleitrophica]|uniref:biotin--[acetyl-CoA-carboxylase] ligase n=1 Tax=Xylanimonas oleitrophica TaxID=2607479 RepID=UPI001FE6FD59|nr:biotin--[acetyl-CoA-carboxylase] ligase [Xylanimonas oleitrophica]